MDRVRPVDFARILGIHKSTVTRAIQSGRLIAVDGKLDVQENLRRWESTKAGSRPDVAARHASQRPQDSRTPVRTAENATAAQADTLTDEKSGPEREENLPADQAGSSSLESGTLPYFTARRIDAQNKLVKLGMQLRAGRRYPVEGMRREALALGGTLRASLERLVDQTAPRLAVTSDRAARRDLLEAETRQLRRDLRREFVRSLRRLRAIAGVDRPDAALCGRPGRTTGCAATEKDEKQ